MSDWISNREIDKDLILLRWSLQVQLGFYIFGFYISAVTSQFLHGLSHSISRHLELDQQICNILETDCIFCHYYSGRNVHHQGTTVRKIIFILQDHSWFVHVIALWKERTTKIPSNFTILPPEDPSVSRYREYLRTNTSHPNPNYGKISIVHQISWN